MKTMRTLSLFAALLVLSASMVTAQDEFPQPGPEHKQLAKLAGEWDAKLTCNFPGTEGPIETSGTQSSKMDLDGFFLIADFKSEFFGKPFQGHGITGYDPFKKKYTGVWIDSMGPGIYLTQGEFTKDGKTYNETMTGPGPDGEPIKFRSVIKIKDDDHMTFTMFTIDEKEKETEMMKIEYTRKK